jgi:predicted Holliday junction resolvase-like endonuclease
MSQFFLWFKEMKQLYGFCPCCGEPFRLSDVDLYTKTPPPHTPFDTIAAQEARLDQQVQKFGEQEREIRQAATRRGQQKAARQLRKLSPYLYDRAANANDVKVIFDPVEYLVFHGLTKKRCTLIELVDHPAETSQREQAQQSIESAIKAGNIEWQTFRVQANGTITQEE